MSKKIIMMFLIAVLCVPAVVFAGSSASSTCATKYPVVLSHGMGAQAEILGIIDYWGDIPAELEDNGADVYITSVNAMDSTANKAAQWRQQVLQILAVTGKAKINLIGHSHGTLYSRYAISNLGMASKVASHTSIAGPHRGSVVAEMILGIIPNFLEPLVGDVLDVVMSFIMGDVNGNTVANGYDLVRSNMINVFNPNTPNASGVYYQSYAYKIKNITGGGFLGITWLAMLPFEGDNDGLVSITSAKWGNFKGVIEGSWWAGGVNHLAAVGLLSLPTPGYDPEEFYVNVVADLKSRGY
ncbi:MAG TPA: alpha/beta fold hydrolase [Spirochaetota bacterium]|nr:alpha/beta fold hydrolase [Spirochaetota bacterium]HQO04159.1 alpha/beta fold hydrolase [Spirochaetota bacterium]HQP50469.1 alpha/beta fold hydrolase [Spirochaetota bacterium]